MQINPEATTKILFTRGNPKAPLPTVEYDAFVRVGDERPFSIETTRLKNFSSLNDLSKDQVLENQAK